MRLISISAFAALALAGCSGQVPDTSATDEATATADSTAAAPDAASDVATPAPEASASASPSPSASASPSATPGANASTPAAKTAGAAKAVATLAPVAAPTKLAAAAVTPPPTFARCAVCHNAEKGAGDKIGPNLYGIYGTKAAAVGSYAFSDALKGAGLTWNEATLDTWISGPMAMVPGTRMSFPGIKDPAKRAEIIAFLKASR
ncbi:c-type cytochrome [Novosphingobium lentum]|uniref:c-type cytochrome n=1 Tax=Novosphingobium lentum TaxID=145287 RepID=UPI000B0E1777|nr:c-type cytochrome [Novosphingobium lentum]